MGPVQKHLRKTFLAGVFAAVPVVVTAFVIWYVDHHTRDISGYVFGKRLPFVGILVALVAIYLGGLIATTLLGKWFIGLIDKALSRVPGFRQLYAAWKQVALTPGGGEGMFAQVVLLGDATGATRVLGFTSGQPVGADGRTICVFVPNAPNPLQGRLFFVDRARCERVNMSVEDAFKLLLSTGNYVPETGLSPTGADTTG